jgi:hypothetical protein
MSSQMRLCRFCGKEISRLMNFCPSCGRAQKWRAEFGLDECYSCRSEVHSKFNFCYACGKNIEEGTGNKPVDRMKGFDLKWECDEECGGSVQEYMRYCPWCGKQQVWQKFYSNDIECPDCGASANPKWVCCVFCGCELTNVQTDINAMIGRLTKDSPYASNVFVMMRFPVAGSSDQASKCLEHAWRAIKSTLGDYGLNALRADQQDLSDGGWLWDNVRAYMGGSRYGIAVLENFSALEFNPNVALEYGYMQALGRKVLLLKEDRFQNVRADLIGTLWKEFSASDPTAVSRSVSAAVRAWMKDMEVARVRSA